MSKAKGPLLSDATVQEIQFELLSRHIPNVAEDLEAHPEWWVAVLYDRRGLIKLRDISQNFWNADQVYILAPNEDTAQMLCSYAKEHWYADEADCCSGKQTYRELGGFPKISSPDGLEFLNDVRLVVIWWD